MQKIWKIKPPDAALQKRLSANLSISPFLAQLLINRGLSTEEKAGEFLKSDTACLGNFTGLPDLDKAKNRIQKARDNKEKVLLFSDYDADGLTALAILKNALDKFGLQAECYIPHRLKEGYGLGKDAVRYIRDIGFDLVVTLDCGVSNFREIAELKNQGIETVVIDHHHLSENKIPCAWAVINPKRQDSSYAHPDLAGVGLAYKFASYLLDENLEEELDLAAIGTIADMVPLTGENRVIAKEGLKKLNNTRRPGLSSLIETAGIKNKLIDAQTVSYVLAPRINACGRLGEAGLAFRLLISRSNDEADALAKELNLKNRQRQGIEGRILDEALILMDTEIDLARERVIVLHQDGWHQGVLGIVAAKISAKFHRPAIIVSFNDGLGKGSGRSIDTFHLFDGLAECSNHLEGFGGHKKACGLSILAEKMGDFRKSINRIAWETLRPEDLLPSLSIEACLNLSGLNSGLLDEINSLEPFGQGNPKPVFASLNLKVQSKPEVLGRDTLKFWVSDGSPRGIRLGEPKARREAEGRSVYPAVGFRLGNYFDLVNSGQNLDIAYRLSLDTWKGNNQLQLEIEDLRITPPTIKL